MEGGAGGQFRLRVQDPAPEVAGDLSELELGAPKRETQLSRALPEGTSGGDGSKELRVQVGAMIAVVHAKCLTREGPATRTASEARYGTRPALRLVVTVVEEGVGRGFEVLGTAAIGAARRLEHEKNPPCRP